VGNEGILQTVTMEEITKLLPLHYQYIHHWHLAVKIIVYVSSIRIAPFRQYGASQITTSAVPSYFSRYTFVIFTKFCLPLRTNTKAYDLTQDRPFL
jgi:hypothetical protein